MLILMTMGWVMVISMFMGKDIFDFDLMATKPVTDGAMVFLIIGMLILSMILCLGYKVNSMANAPTWMVVLFGFATFVCMIVFYGQAGAINVLSHIEERDIDMACEELNGKMDAIQG
jgi:hypothetical protein